MNGLPADVFSGPVSLGEVLEHVFPMDAPLCLVLPLGNPHHGRLSVEGKGPGLRGGLKVFQMLGGRSFCTKPLALVQFSAWPFVPRCRLLWWEREAVPQRGVWAE